jgi:hypothetical protein
VQGLHGVWQAGSSCVLECFPLTLFLSIFLLLCYVYSLGSTGAPPNFMRWLAGPLPFITGPWAKPEPFANWTAF